MGLCLPPPWHGPGHEGGGHHKGRRPGTPASHPGPWVNSDPPLAPGPRQRAGQAEGCRGTRCNRGVSGDTCKGQLDTWSGVKSAGLLAVGVGTHSPGEAAAPRGPRRRVRGSVRRGLGAGGVGRQQRHRGDSLGLGEGTEAPQTTGPSSMGHGHRPMGSQNPTCFSEMERMKFD